MHFSFLRMISFFSYLYVCQVLGETIHITIEYLTNEEKVVMADSKVEVLEAKSSKLRKDLILVMDEGTLRRRRSRLCPKC